MLACLATLCLLLQENAPQTPSAADVARVEGLLDDALRSRDLRAIEAAMRAAQEVPHPSVVRKVARGLEDERREVNLAALQALRWLQHADAFDTLALTAKDRKWVKVPELHAALLRALGQHADPAALPLFVRDPFEPEDRTCLQARLFGLARLRTREALEAVLGIIGVTGSGGERRLKPWMEDARVALMTLTGVDQGLSPELWEAWWRNNKKGFQIPAKPPVLPKELRAIWDGYWGLPREYEREKRREDRGREPQRPREK